MIASVEGSVALSIADHVPELSIICNDSLESLLFDRNTIGLEFKRRCRAASEAIVRHLPDELSREGTAELMILSKGIAYQLSDAVESQLGLNLPLNMISTTRVAVDSEGIEIAVSYQRFDAGGAHLVIGDTVASGETIVAALSAYREVHDLQSVTIISFAGALVGAVRIAEYCRAAGIECRLLFGLAAFGLGDNGFDLSFLHPETLTLNKYIDRAVLQFEGKAVSAVGWDFGTQYVAPTKYQYLCWAESVHWNLVGHASLALAAEPPDIGVLANEKSAFASR